MKVLTSAGATLVALLSLAALTTASASAHYWAHNGIPLTAAEKVESFGTLHFNEGAVGVSYRCTLDGKVTVGPGALGEVTSVVSEKGASVIPCTVEKVGIFDDTSVEIKAVNLPWKTELVTLYEELRNLKLETGGTPGWEVKLNSPSNGKETWACVAAGSTAMHNKVSGVEAVYNEKTPVTKCSVPWGASKFQTSGSEEIFFPFGGGPVLGAY
jgi:hypothetical protein